MKKLLAILFFIFELCLVQAQTNLVPNPSFEDTFACPPGANSLSFTKYWLNPTASTPDFYHSCSLNSGVPTNPFGYQYAHSGNAYAGIVCKESAKNSREYIQIGLIDKLLADKSMYRINKIDVLFTNSSFFENTFFTISQIPQIRVYSNSFYSDTLNWMEIKAVYTAIGDEQFITIGNFDDDDHTGIDSINGNFASLAYYYIDDVSVTLCDTCKDVDTTKSNNLFVPDAFSPNGDGVNDKLFVRGNNIKELYFAVYDRWGEKVFESTDKNNAWDGTYKGNTLNGAVFVYYCFGKYNDGAEFKQKGDVTLIR